MKNKRALSLMCFQMLESGADRRTVKRALTSRRVKGRQAVVLLCKQEMTLLRAGKLPFSD
ncbi:MULTISPECIES: hypothetical protein [Citrobacter freundii complex]|uniref:Uncharacterized protein n=1 Tax=Citrobacter freundii TaxID=546 RepID=A0AAN4A3M9_CITFR|nr:MULTISPECIES: hypothetical protein [Citrobacter]ASG43411.1 hypothetical protein CES93_07115 [Citrobacter freundii]EIJ8972026.1 hypothetical protein [Citrobacter freundii]EIJ8977442.1 hypothetical protein [Citrobacter freundii]EJD5385160.1 hypothetical protein [Citrobacter freundii]EJG9715158.1 hypothetical protein [Citrobacter freundii]